MKHPHPDLEELTAEEHARDLADAWRCWTDNAGHQADDVPMDSDALDDRTVARWDMDRHGKNITGEDESPTEDAPSIFLHFGKKAAGRTLDGRTWDELPAGAPS